MEACNGISDPVVTFTGITIGSPTSEGFKFDSVQQIQLLFTYFETNLFDLFHYSSYS